MCCFFLVLALLQDLCASGLRCVVPALAAQFVQSQQPLVVGSQARTQSFLWGGGGGGIFPKTTFSSINVIAYIGIYKMKCLKMLF